MNPLILGPVLEVGSKLIERFFPDKEKAAEAEREFLKMAVNGELTQVMGQLEINAREAQHASVFVAGWRPAYGWAGVAGFIYAVIAQPVLAWYAINYGWQKPPEINIDLLWVVITGMLGIGGLRTWEKKQGLAK